jgi:hypothetical protein
MVTFNTCDLGSCMCRGLVSWLSVPIGVTGGLGEVIHTVKVQFCATI